MRWLALPHLQLYLDKSVFSIWLWKGWAPFSSEMMQKLKLYLLGQNVLLKLDQYLFIRGHTLSEKEDSTLLNYELMDDKISFLPFA